MQQPAEQVQMFEMAREIAPQFSKRDYERHINEIVGVFSDPVIVHLSPWADTLPDWIPDQIHF